MDDPRNPEKAPEKAIDGLLSHSLRRALDPAGPACPDAEILAAYCEHSLSRPETSRWEAHFATCSRCQAQLADMVRSAEAGDVVGGEGVAPSWGWFWGWLWSWQGLVPVASAAVVVLALWVVDPASLLDRSPSQETAFGEPALVAPAASAPEAEERAPGAEAIPAEPELAAPRLELDQATRETFAVEPQAPRARRPQQANQAQAASPPQTAPDRDAQDVQSQLSAQPLERALSAPPPPAAAARADDQLPDSPVPADAFQASRAATVAENRAVQFGVTGGAAAAVAEARLADARVASTTPSILWRLGASGRIERSTDEGQSWTLQADVGVELLAGSAPSELVCWVVGRGGMVMRTTDGERWNQAAAPTDQDLVGIDAQDAMNATVIGADGSRFVTTDGGQTWSSSP